MRSRIRQTIVLLGMNLGILVLGLLALELAFGDWLRPGHLNKLNLVRGRRITYAIKGLYDSPSPAIVYTRDPYGLRGTFHAPSEIDLLTVGGSTTDQRCIGDGQTWQDVLQDRLQAVNRTIVVGNAGVEGQSTVGHLRNFDWWFPFIPGLRPRYILFYIGINDLFQSSQPELDLLLWDHQRKPVLSVLQERSVLYHLLRTSYGMFRAKRGSLWHESIPFAELAWTTQPRQDSYKPMLAGKLAAYAARLDALVKRTRAMGAEPIFVTQPTRYCRSGRTGQEGVARVFHLDGRKINGLDCGRMLREFDSVTLAVGAKHGAICVDIAGNCVWDDADFYDFVHMTPSGTRKLGEALFEALKDRLR